ncbi:MAG: type II secretion system major pseudopilin GspG [Treponema sp.]|nr:type II secretion system major pseudopilin GspG [Candidatus Treponema equifaecale]
MKFRRRGFFAERRISRNLNCEKNDKWDSGFSFVETLAVLAITGILSSSIGIASHKIVQRARIVATKNQMEQLKVALHSYYADCGRFPTEEQGLEALWKKPELYPVSENWAGPYLDKFLDKDSWGNKYLYLGAGNSFLKKNAPEGLPYAIVSYGADGIEGGENDEKDLYSWE